MSLLSSFSWPEFWVFMGIAVSIARYITYFQAIYRKEARPHVFTWFNWGVLTGIGALAQYSVGGGSSVIILAFTSISCLLIAALALKIGEKNITRSDWIAFISALIAIPVWKLTSNPLYAVALVVFIDVATYYPTVRKSWNDPWGEPPFSYFIAGSRYIFAALAVEDKSFATVIYPIMLASTDWLFVLYILWRQRVLRLQIKA